VGEALVDRLYPVTETIFSTFNLGMLAVIALAANLDFSLHANRKIVGIALRNQCVDLEAGEIDDGHNRHIPGHRGLLIDQQVANDSVDR